jgi:hypothetical protein
MIGKLIGVNKKTFNQTAWLIRLNSSSVTLLLASGTSA